MIQLIVAANPEYYGCNDEDLICQYEEWLEEIRVKIACELTCMEIEDLDNQVFRKENIPAGATAKKNENLLVRICNPPTLFSRLLTKVPLRRDKFWRLALK